MPVCLHAHSWYSLLEGASSPDAMLARACEGGHTALALTDTNNIYGAMPFLERGPHHKVRPLLGACLRQHRTRCVALVAERAGYRSLCHVLSGLHLGAFEERPATLADLLCANAEGLHVLADDPVLAERLREAFGRRLWLEVVRPREGAGGPRHERELLECGRRLGLKPVASTAAHFATPDDYPAFRLVTAVRQRALLDRVPATLAVTPAHHLATAAEMRRRFADLPEALDNADALAELLRSDVLPREVVLPEPKLRPRIDPVGYLRALCERGLRQRDLGADIPARERLREELAIIEAAGLPGYFLTVRDITRGVRRRGHSMALRGSAGNSLVCYLLGITDVNPLRFGLALERFLHPGRADLPDIDLDFDWKVRDAVIADVFRRYGAGRVARISSHLFLQPRSAFREAAKVHGLSDEQVSSLLTTLGEKVDDLLLPPLTPGPSPPEGRGEKEGHPLTTSPPHHLAPSAFPLEPERWPRLVADARRLLGRPRNLSLHPGGVVITPGPVADHVPLEMAAKGVVMTQFEKDAIEHVGLVKIDLLGNRALATVDEARLHSGATRGGAADRDPATVALLRRGDTLGVNQLESPAMRHLLIQMRPTGLNDVIQSLALLRPAAAAIGMKECFIRRRAGLEPKRVLHPRLAKLLEETEGLLLYEDDGLRLIRELTGLPAADADRFRKRIAKHRTPEEAGALEAEFVALCGRRGVPAEAVAELWVQLAKFNRYSFCKSHAVSYGLIAWEAAYLKAHHPVAFWTAALNNNQGAYPRRVYVEAVKRAGIGLRLPCVNRSSAAFTPEGGAIRVGLAAVAGLPQAVCAATLEQREKHGPYLDLADFRRRVGPGPEALAVLIRAGALDFTGRPRPGLFLDAELQDRLRGDGAELFPGCAADGWSPADYPAERRLRDEWELFGFVLGPPLFSLFRPQAGAAKGGPPLVTSTALRQHRGRTVRVQGLVATARHVFTEDGRPLQFVTLEDEHGLAEVTLFPGTCPQVPYLTMGPYTATGTVEEQCGVFTLTARNFERTGQDVY